ncbi:hypothetical protein SSPH_04638 [Sporomusa sphaeroides DSM 2875]|uniref:Uncharacterized protein n=1 Tax=Sporomusa sphaeroides DSM 2875 TaxID=1337886 RepID=A0ABP2CD58_9FIRM|nr:hypothetical protein SSPH_04638 [Sporomusa sphaeroides DSM 2875]
MVIGVGNGLPDFFGFVVFVEGADRTDGYALAAVDAGAVLERPVEGGGDFVVYRPVGGVDGADGLDFLAHFDAAAAFDAFGHVADDDAVGGFDRDLFGLVFKQGLSYAKVTGQLLEFTVGVSDALEAVLGMFGQYEFKHVFSGLADSRAVGDEFGAVPDFVAAGGFEFFLAFKLDYAQTAGSTHFKVRMVAEYGNVDADHFGGI